MNTYRYVALLFSLFIVLFGKVDAQTAPDSGLNTCYHYASATATSKKGISFYVSEVTSIPFNTTDHPLKDANLKPKLEEQYIRFLQEHFGDSINLSLLKILF